jgi:plastocyanin
MRGRSEVEVKRTEHDGEMSRRYFLRGMALVGTIAVLKTGSKTLHGMSAERADKEFAENASDVVIDNFSFSPPTATVAVGTTVTWTNRDDIPHNVVSVGQKFKSPVLDTDEKFSHRFDNPGSYEYFCSIHPKMTGEIVVRGQ